MPGLFIIRSLAQYGSLERGASGRFPGRRFGPLRRIACDKGCDQQRQISVLGRPASPFILANFRMARDTTEAAEHRRVREAFRSAERCELHPTCDNPLQLSPSGRSHLPAGLGHIIRVVRRSLRHPSRHPTQSFMSSTHTSRTFGLCPFPGSEGAIAPIAPRTKCLSVMAL